MLKYILNAANLITLSSMFCGFYAITHVVGAGPGDEMALYKGALAIIVATILDGLDGRVARMTGGGSEFGVQLDSLADLVSFGVAPAVLMYYWGLYQFGTLGLVAAFLFLAAGCFRLARFNITCSDMPKGFSQGLTITQSAGMVAAAMVFFHRVLGHVELQHPEYLVVASLGFAFLMISDVWFRTLKDLRGNRRGITFMSLLFISLAVIIIRTQEIAYILLFYPSLHVATGVLEEIVRFARGHTHEQLLAEHHATLIANDPHEELEEMVETVAN